MTAYIHIEPAHRHRPAFATWGLSQVPPLQTASAQGWDVPVDLYPDVPVALLDGAYVDGFLYDRPEPPAPAPQAVSDPLAAVSDPLAAVSDPLAAVVAAVESFEDDALNEPPPINVPTGDRRTQEARRRRTTRARKDDRAQS